MGDGSFAAFAKTSQAAPWVGKVGPACKASPFVKEMVNRLIHWETSQDIAWSKAFWKNALELNMAIGRGAKSRFARFIGKKILGIKKVALKLKASAKKIGLKFKADMKKTGL